MRSREEIEEEIRQWEKLAQDVVERDSDYREPAEDELKAHRWSLLVDAIDALAEKLHGV